MGIVRFWMGVVWVVALFAACGGGSSLVWEDHDRTYLSLDDRDGFVLSDGTAETLGGGPAIGDADLFVNGLAGCVIYSFETGGISDDAVVESATLRVYQESVQGSPYTDLGDLVVDHVQIGSGLDGADYGGGTLASNVGTLSTTPALAWKTVDVTALVQADVTAGRLYTEFRLRFTTPSDTDNALDLVGVNDGADSLGSSHVPELVVSYRAPRL